MHIWHRDLWLNRLIHPSHLRHRRFVRIRVPNNRVMVMVLRDLWDLRLLRDRVLMICLWLLRRDVVVVRLLDMVLLLMHRSLLWRSIHRADDTRRWWLDALHVVRRVRL